MILRSNILFLAAIVLTEMQVQAQFPVITNQPSSRVLWTGGNVVFSAGVPNAADFSYQWQFDGTNLPNGIITTVAGGSVKEGIVATNAILNYPASATFDAAGNLYIADSKNDRIRKVDAHGVITTVAGNGASASAGNGGAATNAAVGFPTGVAVDPSGNLYIAENGNGFIRKVDTNGIITIFAGNGGDWSNLGDGGAATNAILIRPTDVALDSAGDLFIADAGNNRIREVLTNGIIITVAGNTRFEGAGSYSGDGGAATNATLNDPNFVTIDGAGDVFIADAENSRIREVNTSGIITTVAGGGTNAPVIGCAATNVLLNACYGMALDASGNLFIADSRGNLVLEVNSSGVITMILGNGTAGFAGDGGSSQNAVFNIPLGVAVDKFGNLVIADVDNNRIREINNQGVINTIAGSSAIFEGDGSPAPDADLFLPFDVAVDRNGDLFISDNANNLIRKVNTNGIITTVAGVPAVNQFGGYSGDGGPATNGVLNMPIGVALDGFGNLFIADGGNNVIRKVDTNGIITTFAGELATNSFGGTGGYFGDGGLATNAAMQGPEGIASDAGGDLFIADSENNVIRKVDANGIITTVAGDGPAYIPGAYSGDGGAATNASLNYPSSVAVDGCGNIFIADTFNNVIRKVDTNGIITTIAGNGTPGYAGDGGPATIAALDAPNGLAIDTGGNLIIADTSNSAIRKVDTNGIITTLSGNGSWGFSGDGNPAASATLADPHGLTFDAYGNLFIADLANNRVRKVTNTQGPDLALNEVTAANSGAYQLIVNGPHDSVTNSVTLTVASIPLIYRTFPSSQNSISLDCVSPPGSTNTVFSTTSLMPPVFWQAISTNVAAGDGDWQFTDPGMASHSGGLYRFVTR